MSEELTKTKLLPIQGKDMDSIMQNLETGVAELFTSERYQEYLKTMSKFHNYSFNNTLLIAMQRPDATLVTGYRNWQSMGRQVKKGEKGITIIAPAPIKRKKEQAVLDHDQKPVIGPDGKPKTEEVEVTLPCFKAITVFDIEQTTGEPIQTLAPEILLKGKRNSKHSSWTYGGKEISYKPFKIREFIMNMLMKKSSIDDSGVMDIEHVTCPLLLITSIKDEIWDSYSASINIMTKAKSYEKSIVLTTELGHMNTISYLPNPRYNKYKTDKIYYEAVLSWENTLSWFINYLKNI